MNLGEFARTSIEKPLKRANELIVVLPSLNLLHNIGKLCYIKRLYFCNHEERSNCMKKMAIKNDIVNNLKTKLSNNKIKISFGNKIGLGYDGCGTHTHK